MITSTDNPKVRSARKLLKAPARKQRREFLVEGWRAVHEALTAGAPLRCLFLDPGKSSPFRDLPPGARSGSSAVYEVSSPVMKTISATATSPGVVAVCGFVDIPPGDLVSRNLSLVAVLGQVRDPGNAGTILRTSLAAGADGAFLVAGTVDPYNPKLVRASAGALFSLPWAREVPLRWLLEELAHRGVRRVAADPKGGTVYDQIDMRKPTAFLLGNEAWGLSPEVLNCTDERAVIPMVRSSESLNVAVTSAVMLFEAARQRRNRAGA